MLRVFIDCNRMVGPRTVAIHSPEDQIPEELRKEGTRVILYEPGMECEGILRRTERPWEWVADIVAETVRDIPIADEQRRPPSPQFPSDG